jgi:hypothetical protein
VPQEVPARQVRLVKQARQARLAAGASARAPQRTPPTRPLRKRTNGSDAGAALIFSRRERYRLDPGIASAI